MTTTAMARTTLPERLFALANPADVDQLLAQVSWCAIFKAGTSDMTFDAWRLVQQALEPRVDVGIGLIQLPAGRAASDHVASRSGVPHKSPQLLLFRDGVYGASLDERAISPESLSGLLHAQLPAAIGARVQNPRVVSLGAYRMLAADFVAGRLPEERFQWAFLERLAREAGWRDEPTFELLNGLFENPWGRDVYPARLVAHEFQGQLAGRLAPLNARATRWLEHLPSGTE
jgi:hypothetical protein